jgi:hypothetical protein
MMDIGAYARAVEQRGALRRKIHKQLAELRGAYGSLKGAAETVSAGQPNLVIGSDPLSQVGPLVAEAASLSSRLRQNASQVAALEKELAEAEAAAGTAMARRVGIAIAVAIGLMLYFYFKH